MSHKRAYDLLVQAESGSCAITGYPGMPAKPGPPMADFTTGLYAAMSILALLFARVAVAEGAAAPSVELSLFDVMTDVMGYAADLHPALRHRPAAARASARPRSRRTARFPPATARPWCSAPPTTASGSGWPGRSSIAPTWPTIARFRTNAGRCAHREILDEAIGSWCAQHDLAEIQKIADEAGIGNSRYNLPSEVVVHPQLTARDRWRTVGTPKGDIQALRPPPVISGFEQPMGAVPGLGEHTDAVLGELGVGPDELARLRAEV